MKNIIIIILLLAFMNVPAEVLSCTTAVIGADATRHGRTLLWKHRDSGYPDNFVDHVAATDTTMAYVALFNAGDGERAEAWIGFNSAGFAVMNAASYNLAPDTALVKDREGVIMTMALKQCHSVADFGALLDRMIAAGEPLGVQANFGATDAHGEGAYFETYDHGYKVYGLKSGDDVIIRTNFSFSGGDEKKLGQVRYENAQHLLKCATDSHDISPELLSDTLSRSYYYAPHDVDFRETERRTVPDRGEFISRRSSCASVTIEGAKPGEDPAKTMVMWVMIGFPAASYVVPVTLDDVPHQLQPDRCTGRSELCDEANKCRSRAFHLGQKDGNWIVDLDYLRQITPEKIKQSHIGYMKGRANRARRSK